MSCIVLPPAPSTLLRSLSCMLSLFFFTDTATPETYTLSLHDALPICWAAAHGVFEDGGEVNPRAPINAPAPRAVATPRSEEHTSELQSLTNLVCRLLLEKKKKIHQEIKRIQSTCAS